MRGKELQCRRYWWSNKKSQTPQPLDSEPKNLRMNRPPKPAPASLEGTTKMNKDVMRPTGATADHATARLGSSLHLKGEISGNEDLHIDGAVEGAVQLGEGKLTVGATANVTADIIAREVVVCGKVKGNVHAKGKIGINEDGSYFKGSIEIDRSADKEADNNASSRTASTPTTPAAAGAAPKSI